MKVSSDAFSAKNQVICEGIGVKKEFPASRFLRSVDKDDTGIIDFREINHFCHTLSMGTKQDKMKFLFDACDVFSNGVVEV